VIIVHRNASQHVKLPFPEGVDRARGDSLFEDDNVIASFDPFQDLRLRHVEGDLSDFGSREVECVPVTPGLHECHACSFSFSNVIGDGERLGGSLRDLTILCGVPDEPEDEDRHVQWPMASPHRDGEPRHGEKDQEGQCRLQVAQLLVMDEAQHDERENAEGNAQLAGATIPESKPQKYPQRWRQDLMHATEVPGPGLMLDERR
jgi:hypothetical protein